MSELVGIVHRNEQSGAPIFEPRDVHRRACGDRHQPRNHRFRDESVEVARVDRGINPRIDAGKVVERWRPLEGEPLDVVARAMKPRDSQLDDVAKRGPRKRTDSLCSVGRIFEGTTTRASGW